MRMDQRNFVALTPTYNTESIGYSPASWGKQKAVSSIFKKPNRHHATSHHPSHLHVPILSTASTSSFAEAWLNGGSNPGGDGSRSQHGFPPPHPPPTRSPGRTIRFLDETQQLRDDHIEITPSPHVTSRKQLSTSSHFHGGCVSRRGRRPGLISRHSTH